MKKYVKPVASGIHFVVNENIATSITHQIQSSGSFIQTPTGEVFLSNTGIVSRIPEGEKVDLMTFLSYCIPEEYDTIKAMMSPENNTFNCY